MKNYRIALFFAAALVLGSCGKKAEIVCTVADAPDSEFVIKLLNVKTYDVLDTVKSNAAGTFRYSVEIEKGQPEFVYVFNGDTQIAALLLETGEKAVVTADRFGNYSVSGSDGSASLKEVNERFASFMSTMRRAVDASDSKAASTEYVKYYRECVKYVISNPFSLTSIPVLYQRINTDSPVFAQPTDALYFRSVCDSLKTKYPDSRYVKSLEAETVRREKSLALNSSFNLAGETGFPDLNIADVNGKKVALSSVDAKVIMLYFWSSTDAEQKMTNVESLLPLYKEFHPKGFEIYSVCVDIDKAEWVSCVKNQELPWINVNDGLGAASGALIAYNVASLPCTFLIADGTLTGISATSEAEFRKEIARLLK